MPIEYDVLNDFLNWTSFPSSLKIINKRTGRFPYINLFVDLPVTPGSKITASVKNREENSKPDPTVGIWGFYFFTSPTKPGPEVWPGNPPWMWFTQCKTPTGTHNWMTLTTTKNVPPGHYYLMGVLVGSAGSVAVPSVTWFDDAKVYQDDVLIYSNDFSNWDPLIGAGVGAPIGGVAGYLLKEPLGPMVSEVVGAVLGGALGGGIGLLTGLGIIPVPQIPIPTFGATPEEPGAPAQLGKYQITG